jgi:hypothetical protein
LFELVKYVRAVDLASLSLALYISLSHLSHAPLLVSVVSPFHRPRSSFLGATEKKSNLEDDESGGEGRREEGQHNKQKESLREQGGQEIGDDDDDDDDDDEEG